MSHRLRNELVLLAAFLVALLVMDATLWAPTTATFVIGDVVVIGLLASVAIWKDRRRRLPASTQTS